MNRLLEIGFEPAGHWLLNGNDIEFKLVRHARQTNVLYAFVSDGEVKYVGKTTRPLQIRMSGYKNPSETQSTNIRNKSLIKELLLYGAAVDILALPDDGLLHYGQFHLNLAAGLEDSIISVIVPAWNRSKLNENSIGQFEKPNSVVEAQKSPTTDAINHVIELPPKPRGLSLETIFEFVVQPTYYKSGFFNVGVMNSSLLGDDGEKIEIYCGEDTKPIIGTINRTANSNETPRIMGGKGLKDWFQSHLHSMERVRLKVLSPVMIVIQKM